ncbi:MAG: hypothetical protein K6E10_12820 [Eubacterium sp.]|nr:hypothetical protein [Eubacterium sp.]
MSEIVKIKNTIRGFFRKEDELISPILRFIFSYILFISIQKLFGYNELASKKEVTFLLAVLTALLPDGFLFFMSGLVIALHCFSVSLETGAVFVLIYILMYAIYMRFFPKYAYVILMVPIFYMLNIPFAAPVIIGLVAGIAGFVPAVFGVVLYFFSQIAAEIARLMEADSAENEIEAIKQLTEVLISNKEMYTTMMTFAITVIVIGILTKFSYKYAVYIAIAGGTIINILGAIISGFVMSQDVPLDKVILGSIIGGLIGIIIRFGMGFLDYGRTERVQFEDDDYYYYVKAVPKIDAERRHPRTKQGKAEKEALERMMGKTKKSPVVVDDIPEEFDEQDSKEAAYDSDNQNVDNQNVDNNQYSDEFVEDNQQDYINEYSNQEYSNQEYTDQEYSNQEYSNQEAEEFSAQDFEEYQRSYADRNEDASFKPSSESGAPKPKYNVKYDRNDSVGGFQDLD